MRQHHALICFQLLEEKKKKANKPLYIEMKPASLELSSTGPEDIPDLYHSFRKYEWSKESLLDPPT